MDSQNKKDGTNRELTAEQKMWQYAIDHPEALNDVSKVDDGSEPT